MWRPSTPCPWKNCPHFCPVQLVNFEWLAVHSYTQALCSDSCCRALRQQLLEISKAGWLAGSLSRWDRNQQHRPLEKWHFWRCKGTIFPRWGMMFQGFPGKPFFPRWDMLIYVDLWVPWRVKELSLITWAVIAPGRALCPSDSHSICNSRVVPVRLVSGSKCWGQRC